MDSKLTTITKVEIENLILPIIPINKRGFPSKVNSVAVIQFILHKLKTGSQWHCLFSDIEGYRPNYSWQLVYYYYRKWSKQGVFKNLFDTTLIHQSVPLNIETLQLDGTHSLAKKQVKLLLTNTVKKVKRPTF